jgi:hypothetical protein
MLGKHGGNPPPALRENKTGVIWAGFVYNVYVFFAEQPADFYSHDVILTYGEQAQKRRKRSFVAVLILFVNYGTYFVDAADKHGFYFLFLFRVQGH